MAFTEKTINVGEDYQAEIPDFVKSGERSPERSHRSVYFSLDHADYPEDDKLLWDPTKLDEKEVGKYLEHVKMTKKLGEEQALYLLLQQKWNASEAKRRIEFLPEPLIGDNYNWTEDELASFERGIKLYGKDFHQVKKAVPAHSVAELVELYYNHKKAARFGKYAKEHSCPRRKFKKER